MGQPYIGEIRMFAGNYAPTGWAFCAGQLLPISENDALYVLIGTTYGGDGQQNFALPDLRGRVPLHHQGNSLNLGEAAGVESVTLTTQQMPTHTHPLTGTTAGATSRDPGNLGLGVSPGNVYTDQFSPVPLKLSAVGGSGGSQPHDNMQPYLCISFIISLYGLFPPPSS